MQEAGITIVGLGSGDENQLTLGIWKKLQSSEIVYLRTGEHPVAEWLQQQDVRFATFDALYEEHSSFDDVYQAIADQLLDVAQTEQKEIIYAVPGHPMVAERTVQLLKQYCPERQVVLSILGGESFLDQVFLQLGFDPVEGFQLLDGTEVSKSRLNPQVHTIITQVYDAFTASEVKLGLMDVYPDDYEVVVGHALGVAGQQSIQTIPLYELDQTQQYGNLSLVWIPRTAKESLRNRSFDRLHEIVQYLRSPEGCPWDREQTHASIRKNLIEETYEVLETIDDDDPVAMCEELGDILLQIMLHSQMEEEEGVFSVYDVIAELNEKLIRRHPHVFGNVEASNADEGMQSWEQAKQEEKRSKGIDVEHTSVLSGVPRDLPALMKAWKIQKKAASVGFDWDRIEDVYAKVLEELQELQEVMLNEDAAHKQMQTEELGDLLFAIVNLARFLKIDPEDALVLTNRKFTMRFTYIEQQLRLKGQQMEQTKLTEMEQLWQEAKKVLESRT